MRQIIFLFLIFLAPLKAEQKVVLISGSNGGIGKEIVNAFAKKGWKVWAGYHTKSPQDFLRKKKITPCFLDVTNDQSIQAAVEKIMKKEGRIDCLIHNAGYGLIGPEESFTIEEIKDQFDVNLFGAVRLVQAVAPIMREQKNGHILMVSSTSGIRAVPGLGLYASSKFALEGLSESLAASLAPWNIHVSLIIPGTVKNNWVKHCQLGSRNYDAPSDYEKLTKTLSERLSTLAKTGQPPKQIGELMVRVAESGNPDLRYATSEQVETVILKKHIETSGNTLRGEQIQLYNSLVDSCDKPSQ